VAGGRGELRAWGFAFASLGVVALVGVIPARMLAKRDRNSRTEYPASEH